MTEICIESMNLILYTPKEKKTKEPELTYLLVICPIFHSYLSLHFLLLCFGKVLPFDIGYSHNSELDESSENKQKTRQQIVINRLGIADRRQCRPDAICQCCNSKHRGYS